MYIPQLAQISNELAANSIFLNTKKLLMDSVYTYMRTLD